MGQTETFTQLTNSSAIALLANIKKTFQAKGVEPSLSFKFNNLKQILNSSTFKAAKKCL